MKTKASIEAILEDYKQGKMIILMDDEGRENEGDLIIPAATCTKEDINFMATHGRGVRCLTLTQERCKQLNLPLMRFSASPIDKSPKIEQFSVS
jgi:3,4-dihydroxy 2-butanone 4-phosphate synthase/GTP cyclohydrolase II